MSLNLVSPGVKVREVDLTIGRVDAINEQVGAFSGPFEKGPVNTPILIETEQDLLSTFGKPKKNDRQYEYWMSASSYLSYGGVMKVVRAGNSNLNNANAGVNAANVTVKIENYENYVNDHQSATDWHFAAKDPGKWSDNLKVCQIDAFADQIITGAGATAGMVGYGITQGLVGRDNPGIGVTGQFTDGYLRGVVTGVDTTKDEIYVKISEQVSAGGTATRVAYDQGGVNNFLTPTSSSTTTTTTTVTGVGTYQGHVDTAFDITITGISTANVTLGLGVTGTNVAAGTTVVAIGTSEVTVDRAITVGAGTTQIFTFNSTTTSTTTTSSYTNPIWFVGTTGSVVGSAGSITSASMTDWYDQQTLGLTNTTLYWKSIAPAPGTSQYANERSGANDEVHVVVVDDNGDVTGTAGNIVEKHLNLSKGTDVKISPSENVYYKDYIATKSSYIYVGSAGTVFGSGTTGVAGGNTYTANTGGWGSTAQSKIFSVSGNKTYTLTGGKDYSGGMNDGYDIGLGGVITGYKKFAQEADYSFNFLIMGPSGGTEGESKAKAKELIALADLRKDCIACISPHREGIVGISDSDTQTENIINFFNPISSSSYAVFDTGYKYVYDRFNNQFVYIPCNGDTAGLMARTSINQYSWFSPAGNARGSINSAVKLAYNPTQAQRDQIYPKAINPIVSMPGSGIILFGDRTALKYASAFDRINVRRLFLTIEGTIERAARSQLFEFNDVITRSNFVNIVEPYLRDVKSKRGITDFVVICDETNNTPDIIDANQFKADIFVKPARSINFIGLTFVATRTGVSFEEVVGNV